MLDNKYHYFISYTVHGFAGGVLGFGNNEFTSDRPIETMADINAIETEYASIIDKNLRNTNRPGGPVSVVILQWQLLSAPYTIRTTTYKGAA